MLSDCVITRSLGLSSSKYTSPAFEMGVSVRGASARGGVDVQGKEPTVSACVEEKVHKFCSPINAEGTAKRRESGEDSKNGCSIRSTFGTV